MPGLDGLQVLLVEDESLVAITVEDMLADLGCTVVASAATLTEALIRVDAGGFDLAVLDVNLDGERVFPAADALRRTSIPFVFATGYGWHGLRSDFRDTPVLTKPYRRTELERALRAALSGAQS